MTETPRPWHHRPSHVFEPNTAYVVTASTFHKDHFFRGEARLRLLNDALFQTATVYGWVFEAWAVFSNHYHFIAQSPGSAESLTPFLQQLHSRTAREVNRLDDAAGRRVWFEFWDTCLTHEKSYFARLNYVHNNPVKHGTVKLAELYPFCSAAWFRAQANPQFRKKVESFRYDLVRVPDNF